jgi:hypothetical protein
MMQQAKVSACGVPMSSAATCALLPAMNPMWYGGENDFDNNARGTQDLFFASWGALVSRNNFASRKRRYMVKLNERKIHWIIQRK